MTNSPTYRDFDLADPAHIDAIATLWNDACGPTLAISSHAVRYNTQPVSGGTVVGQLAYQDEQPIGFVVASTLNQPSVISPEIGWVDAIAVTPSAQNQGIGSALLTWAEQWLSRQACRTVIFGASQRPYAPGLPVELNKLAFFTQHGYIGDHTSWDTAMNLALYETPELIFKGRVEVEGPESKAMIRPGQKGEEGALLEFLQREFPGRWRFEFEEFIREKPYRFSDYMLVWTDRGVDGFCQLTFEDSRRPLERFFPYALPRPWGQLGSVGVSADCRGRGYGLAVVDASLRRLRDNGVNGCVIDWTGIVDFYGKFGFEPFREYHMLRKSLA